MTIREFKAWLEGFGEAINGSPNKKQWDKIKERLAGVDESEQTIIREYQRPWWPNWITFTTPAVVPNSPTWTITNTNNTGGAYYTSNSTHSADVNYANAALEIGKAEAKYLTN